MKFFSQAIITAACLLTATLAAPTDAALADRAASPHHGNNTLTLREDKRKSIQILYMMSNGRFFWSVFWGPFGQAIDNPCYPGTNGFVHWSVDRAVVEVTGGPEKLKDFSYIPAHAEWIIPQEFVVFPVDGECQIRGEEGGPGTVRCGNELQHNIVEDKQAGEPFHQCSDVYWQRAWVAEFP